MIKFHSPGPAVRLIGHFQMPFDGAMAAARTCYSPRDIVFPEDVAPEHASDREAAQKRQERRDGLAQDLLQAGHHTVFQHAHFQFAIGGVSRHLVWSFLHNHPFYNSEQVSQRYVSVKEGAHLIPDAGKLQELWNATNTNLFTAYEQLVQALIPVTTEKFFERFPGRKRKPELWQSAIRKRAQEVARYVLPVGATTYLHHTISGLVLMRYQRARLCGDLPSEQSLLVEAMVQEVLKVAPGYAAVLQEPLPEERFERAERKQEDYSAFDQQLENKLSILKAWAPDKISELDQATGWTRKGAGNSRFADLLTSTTNPILAEALNLSFQDRNSQLLHLVWYSFQKKLSHTADSQDQRHRMTPAVRPFVTAHLMDSPDYVTPRLIPEAPQALQLYQDSMEQLWSGISQLRNQGAADETLQYLLPNAVPIRFYQSSDLTALRHKMEMRLCYNAQEEIWQAAVEEAEAIAEVHPEVGNSLLPPCSLRYTGGTRPSCPEGNRFCGIPVWKLNRSEYERMI